MKLVPEDIRLDSPNVCFVCESTPQREAGVRVVDTERVFNPRGPSNLRGRKYLCEKCIKEAAASVWA